MNVLTLSELRRYSRAELRALFDRIANALGDFPEGSQDYRNALINLRNIRWVLAHYSVVSGCQP